ncbi:MAG: hypothetical protein E6G67_12525 [Actinobacteria bacterium]|nr:MAG: hypothetical protein E6G67_12525 [Actinomycetota bacterium]
MTRGDLEQHDPAARDVPQPALRREHREADDACAEEVPHRRLASHQGEAQREILPSAEGRHRTPDVHRHRADRVAPERELRGRRVACRDRAGEGLERVALADRRLECRLAGRHPEDHRGRDERHECRPRAPRDRDEQHAGHEADAGDGRRRPAGRDAEERVERTPVGGGEGERARSERERDQARRDGRERGHAPEREPSRRLGREPQHERRRHQRQRGQAG